MGGGRHCGTGGTPARPSSWRVVESNHEYSQLAAAALWFSSTVTTGTWRRPLAGFLFALRATRPLVGVLAVREGVRAKLLALHVVLMLALLALHVEELALLLLAPQAVPSGAAWLGSWRFPIWLVPKTMCG